MASQLKEEPPRTGGGTVAGSLSDLYGSAPSSIRNLEGGCYDVKPLWLFISSRWGSVYAHSEHPSVSTFTQELND